MEDKEDIFERAKELLREDIVCGRLELGLECLICNHENCLYCPDCEDDSPDWTL